MKMIFFQIISKDLNIFLLIIILFCLSIVDGRKGFGGSEQEWGYISVRPSAEMFWWLYYTTSTNVSNAYEKPLIIWIEGGPAISSAGYGNFEEIGPLDLDKNPRNHTWVNDYNVLFVDSPVGTGFSYVVDDAKFAQNNQQIAKDLLEFMKGFYKRDPKWSKVPVYIACASYGGKMAAEFSLVWDQAQKSGNITSNFKGVMMIGPWISPIDSILSWPEYLFHTSLVDTKGYKNILFWANKTKTAIEEGNWMEALNCYSQTAAAVYNETGNVDFYNILHDTIFPSEASGEYDVFNTPRLKRFMNQEVKIALNITTDWDSQAREVSFELNHEILKPSTKMVERLLNETNLEVFVVSGQLDLVVATPGTVAWVERLNWKNSTEWHNAKRTPLVIDGVIQGYVKQFGNFKMYWVNKAGHMVPAHNSNATAVILKHMTEKAN